MKWRLIPIMLVMVVLLGRNPDIRTNRAIAGRDPRGYGD